MNFIIFLQDDGHLVMGSLFQLPAPVCYSDPSIIGTSIIRTLQRQHFIMKNITIIYKMEELLYM